MARPRSASAHRKVIDAALKLVAERGVDATSMDAIAHESGVSKATIYKHWADKDALMLEIMADMNGLRSRPKFDSGDTRADMVAVLAYRPPENAEVRDKLMPHFVAYSSRNEGFGLAWRNMVMEPPRRELRHLLKLGIARGELTPELDLDLCIALLIGPVLYWYVFLRSECVPAHAMMWKPDVAQLAHGVVDTFWRAFGIQTSTENAVMPASHR